MSSENEEAIQLGGVYMLKPLEWIFDKRLMRWEASTVFCELRVDFDEDSEEWRFNYCVDEYYDEGSERFLTDTDAKCRGNEWYVERIKNALEPIK